jgi:RNA-directed DNA polymerase
MTNDPQKSDPSVRAMKSANKPEGSGAESMEQRGGTKGNTEETHTRRAQDRVSVTTGLDRVRERAKERKEEKFTTLLHHVDTDLLRRAYFQLKRKAAPGVDRVTWQAYGEQLEANLADLHERVHRGAYRAPPSRRVYIEKEDGRKRPLGISSLEDKLLQRAVIEVLNAIYEADFLGFSYGFRPGRSQHDALDALAYAITTRKVNFILDLDVERFFDKINHGWLIEFLKHRIADRRVLRLIGKWLKAGVMEDAVLVATEEGTPQGGSASPFLANAYLHYCFDLWAERWRRREASGQVAIVRFADDIVCGFEHEADAKRFLEQLRERMGKFSLSLHPEKTRLIEFGRSAAERRAARGESKPETFNFLGFTHIAGKSRAGRFQLKRKTRRDRLRRKVDAVRDELKRRMHDPIVQQGKYLGQVVRGFIQYHGVPGNFRRVSAFRNEVVKLWKHVLTRRSQKDTTTWERMLILAGHWLPPARILHPWPDARFLVKHPRWEPSALIRPARIYAGGAG